MSLFTPTHGSKAVVGRTHRYRVVRSLATRPGSEVAIVYAPDGARERLAVMKRLPPVLATDAAAVERFRLEARIASQLDHPGIVRVYEVVETASEDFYTMEYVRGADMRRLMETLATQQRTLPLDCVLLIAIEVANALDYAHTLVDGRGLPAPVIHGELTPSKILIGHDGKVKLTGFAAPPIGRTPPRRARTESLSYTSPERLVGETLDSRSDVFALGVLLYELSSGERLFGDATTEHEVMQKVLRGDLPRPSEVRRGYPRELETILMRALDRDRGRRYPSASALQTDLETFLWARWPTASTAALAKLVGDTFPWDDVPETTIAEPLRSWIGPSPLAVLLAPPEPPRPPRTDTNELRRIAPAKFPEHSIMQVIRASRPRLASDLAVPVQLPPPMPPIVVRNRAPSHQDYEDDVATIALPRPPVEAAEPAPVATEAPPMPRRMWPWLAAAITGTVVGVFAAYAVRTPKPEATLPVVVAQPSPPIEVELRTTHLTPPPPLVAASVVDVKKAAKPRPVRRVEPPRKAHEKPLFPPPDRLPSNAGTLDGLPSIKTIDASGGITLLGVRKSVEQALSPLRGCYRAAARAKQLTPRVQLTIAFDVGDRRAPTNIRAAGGGPLAALAPCAAKVAADIRDLPSPKGDRAHVTVSLEFRPNPPSP